MSTWQNAFNAACLARINSDTGSGGIVETGARMITYYGVQWVDNPTDGAFPYCCQTAVDANRTDAFTADIFEYQFDVHTFVLESPEGADFYDGLLVGANIIERIRGNSRGVAGGVPTYGFDRWQPDISSTGWVSQHCRMLTEARSEHGDGVYHWIQPFASIVYRPQTT